MKHHTANEIQSFIHAHYKATSNFGWHEPLVDVVLDSEERIVFKVHEMYYPPPFNSALILALCEFFDTKHINDTERWEHGGCETCDWGSDYGFTLEVLPNA